MGLGVAYKAAKPGTDEKLSVRVVTCVQEMNLPVPKSRPLIKPFFPPDL
jgi:hypothetical protein